MSLAEPPHTGLSEARKARIRQCREIVAAQFARKISPAEATRQIDALYAQA